MYDTSDRRRNRTFQDEISSSVFFLYISVFLFQISVTFCIGYMQVGTSTPHATSMVLYLLVLLCSSTVTYFLPRVRTGTYYLHPSGIVTCIVTCSTYSVQPGTYQQCGECIFCIFNFDFKYLAYFLHILHILGQTSNVF